MSPLEAMPKCLGYLAQLWGQADASSWSKNILGDGVAWAFCAAQTAPADVRDARGLSTMAPLRLSSRDAPIVRHPAACRSFEFAHLGAASGYPSATPRVRAPREVEGATSQYASDASAATYDISALFLPRFRGDVEVPENAPKLL